MRSWVTKLCFGVTLFVISCASDRITASDEQSQADTGAVSYRGDVTAVTVIRQVAQHPGAPAIWEPYLAIWAPKHLVCAYGVRVAGKTDMGDIWASVSTDDGQKWSEPVAVFDHRYRQGTIQYAYANPVLYHPPGQDVVWCFAMRCPMAWSHSEDSQLVAAYSGDGGRAWNPVELTMHYTGPVIIVGGIEQVSTDRGLRYLLPVHRNTLRNDPRGSRDQFVLESTSLLEWRLPRSGTNGFIPQPVTGPVFLHEGQLAIGTKPGMVSIVMRTARYDKEGVALDPPVAYRSESADGGHTWSPATPQAALPNTVAKGYFGRSATGLDLYVYNDGPAWSRKALRYKVRPEAGDWSDEKTFYEAGNRNSYPTLVESSVPGNYYAVWDSGDATVARTTIRFGKLQLVK